jgi:hypothetical protein
MVGAVSGRFGIVLLQPVPPALKFLTLVHSHRLSLVQQQQQLSKGDHAVVQQHRPGQQRRGAGRSKILPCLANAMPGGFIGAEWTRFTRPSVQPINNLVPPKVAPKIIYGRFGMDVDTWGSRHREVVFYCACQELKGGRTRPLTFRRLSVPQPRPKSPWTLLVTDLGRDRHRTGTNPTMSFLRFGRNPETRCFVAALGIMCKTGENEQAFGGSRTRKTRVRN